MYRSFKAVEMRSIPSTGCCDQEDAGFCEIGMWRNPVDTEVGRHHKFGPESSQKFGGPGRSDMMVEWSPNNPGINWNNCVNQILHEVWKWEQLEFFSFTIRWDRGLCCPLDVPSVVAALDILMKFLRRAEKSEEEGIHEVMSSFVQTESGALDYIWWLLSGEGMKTIDGIVLGRKLSAVVKIYNLKRRALYDLVESHVECMKAWTGSYTEIVIQGILQDILDLLQGTHRSFIAFKETLITSRLRRPYPKNRGTISKLEIRKKFLDLYVSIFPEREPTRAEDILASLAIVPMLSPGGSCTSHDDGSNGMPESFARSNEGQSLSSSIVWNNLYSLKPRSSSGCSPRLEDFSSSVSVSPARSFGSASPEGTVGSGHRNWISKSFAYSGKPNSPSFWNNHDSNLSPGSQPDSPLTPDPEHLLSSSFDFLPDADANSSCNFWNNILSLARLGENTNSCAAIM